jgi:hypothetical protein
MWRDSSISHPYHDKIRPILSLNVKAQCHPIYAAHLVYLLTGEGNLCLIKTTYLLVYLRLVYIDPLTYKTSYSTSELSKTI